MRKLILIGGVIIGCAAIVAVGIGMWWLRQPHSPSRVAPSLINKDSLATYPKKDASGIDTTHLADGLTPPTNKWFSGAALQSEPKPIFAIPNAYLLKNDGIQLNLPQVTVAPNAVMAGFTSEASLTIAGASRYRVTRYDELSIDFTYYSVQNRELATITIMSGSPYVWLRAVDDIQVTAMLPTAMKMNQQVFGHAGDHWYGVRTAKPETLGNVEGDRATFTVARGDTATMYSASTRAQLDTVARYAPNRVMNAAVEHSAHNEAIQTTFQLHTINNEPTLYTALPHQSISGLSNEVQYGSQFGTLRTIAATRVSFDTKKVSVDKELDFSAVSSEQKAAIVSQLKQDVAATKLDSPDTYFGGKQLQRAAQLLTLAKQLNDTASADQLSSLLRRAFDDWANPQSARGFYYDTKMKGLVGRQAAFGANEFNDHHFHYGYFLYAAGVLARYDTSFVERHANFINLLAADIANYNSIEPLPLRRNFDPYAGHSWASGAAPFADGNNQESSSEAINAWTGLALWADASHNTGLRADADWMLSNEAATATRYWTGINIAGYSHASFGIIWGGKRDWGTWFSAEPNAIVGIQLLPMTPTLANIYRQTPDRLRRTLAQPGLTHESKFGDHIKMAQVLTENGASHSNMELSGMAIDDGNSRSYLMAFIACQR